MDFSFRISVHGPSAWRPPARVDLVDKQKPTPRACHHEQFGVSTGNSDTYFLKCSCTQVRLGCKVKCSSSLDCHRLTWPCSLHWTPHVRQSLAVVVGSMLASLRVFPCLQKLAHCCAFQRHHKYALARCYALRRPTMMNPFPHFGVYQHHKNLSCSVLEPFRMQLVLNTSAPIGHHLSPSDKVFVSAQSVCAVCLGAHLEIRKRTVS